MMGKQFGCWTVIGDCITSGRERKWLCRCRCGTERYVLERSLRSGNSTSCGCQRREAAAHKGHHRAVDITGQRFERLTALYPTERRDKKGSVVWHCRCDCGNELDIPYNNLVYTNIVSCGCRKKEHSRSLSEHLVHVAGTSVDMLKSAKIPVNNTTGYRGVYFIRGKYVAKINFQKKAYYLGTYDSIEDAAQARRAASEQLFDSSASFYERWKQRAEADPEWARKNPVQIMVTQLDTLKFSVTCLPILEE